MSDSAVITFNESQTLSQLHIQTQPYVLLAAPGMELKHHCRERGGGSGGVKGSPQEAHPASTAASVCVGEEARVQANPCDSAKCDSCFNA